MGPADHDAWQAEADLLADGRELLERLCTTRRYAHLFPEGANLALLIEAYKRLDRRRTVRREPRFGGTKSERKRNTRRLRRELRRGVRKDALDRSRRLNWHFPSARPRPVYGRPPAIVEDALMAVDADAREEVTAYVTGTPMPDAADPTASTTVARVERADARLTRGQEQFRQALLNLALANPSQISSLHPQLVAMCASAQPTKKRHPIASFIFVRLPLQMMLVAWTIFCAAYLGAYHYFNDERLGGFLTDTIGGLIGGELAFERVHWSPLLVVDLFLGRPHHIDIQGLRIYEAFKTTDEPKERLAAYAEHLEVDLVLHEIIPFNRLGVPTTLEIPWILHFADARNHGEMWIEVREYQPAGREDEWLLSLIGAFEDANPDQAPPPGLRKLSFQVDRTDLRDIEVRLGMDARSRWGTDLLLERLDLGLSFEGRYPEDPEPARMPFEYQVRAEGGVGAVRLVDLVEEPFEVASISTLEIHGGRGGTPVGDVRIRGEMELAGSPVRFDGFLRDVFGEMPRVNHRITTTDAGPALAHVVGAPAEGQRELVDGNGSAASLAFRGPMDDVAIRAVAQGITLDLFDTPAWALDDVDLSLELARDPVPDEFRSYYTSADADAESPQRWIVYLDTFRSSALDGELRLHGRGGQDLLILAEEGEPLLTSIRVDLDGVNLGQLVPDDPNMRELLRGSSDGGAQLHELAIAEGGTGGVKRAEVQLHDLRVSRDLGPQDDGLPRRLRATGQVVYDAESGIDLRHLRLSTDGAAVTASGGLAADMSTLRPTQLAATVDDGNAFASALAIEPYFRRLSADLGLVGKLMDPRGNGTLNVEGARTGDLSLGSLENARMWIERGVLHVRSPSFALLGGRGPLEIDLVLFERGRLLSDPKLRVFADLEGINAKSLLGSDIDIEDAGVRLFVDDGQGNPVRLSELGARGAGYADRLVVEGTPFSDVESAFTVDREGLRIDRLSLAYTRPISPAHRPEVGVPVGRVEAAGRVGFGDDPSLDLRVQTEGLPLSAVTRFVSTDVPLRGQLAAGSQLSIRGSLSRPRIDGDVFLESLGVSDVPLGRAKLKFSTHDVDPGQSGRRGHHEVRIEGSAHAPRPDRIDWRVKGVVALGPTPRRGERALEANVDFDVTRLPLSALFAHPDRASWDDHLAGEARGLGVHIQHCPSGSSMLAACRSRPAARDDEPTSVEVALLEFRMRAKGGDETPNWCNAASAVCSKTPLIAKLEHGLLQLESPWRLSSGGKTPVELSVAGSVDLRAPDEDPEVGAECRFDQPASLPPGRGSLEVSGDLDLAALAGVLGPLGVRSPKGHVVVDLALEGLAAAPKIRGSVDLPANRGAIALGLTDEGEQTGRRQGERPIDLKLTSLGVQIDQDRLFVEGSLLAWNEAIRFGEVDGHQSWVALGGACAGRWALAAEGSVDGSILRRVAPDVFESSAGAVDLNSAWAEGNFRAADQGAASFIDQLQAELIFGRNAVSLQIPEFDRFTLTGGRATVRTCSEARPCGDAIDGLAFFVGGERGAAAGTAPSTALKLRVGERGTANLWGTARLSLTNFELVGGRLQSRLSMVPFALDDNSGRPELLAAISSERLTLRVGESGNLALSGTLLAERSRWLREPTEGVAVLSFEDPSNAVPTPLPPLLAGLELDLELRTGAPFRVDAKVLDDFEARAELAIAGTLGDPELSGNLEIERGKIDIDLLGATYEIQRGRVIVDREFGRSYVDVLAVRDEQVKIDSQLRTLTMRLFGPLNEIKYECSAIGDTSGELGTARGCLDYVLFDAGNTATATDTLRQPGYGLLGSRLLPVAGRLTQVQVNDYLAERAPRLEAYVPELSLRIDQLGVVTALETKPDWMNWGWGGFDLGVSYTRGYPNSLLRDSRALTWSYDIFEYLVLEANTASRNYTNRVLVLDPPNYTSTQLRFRRLRIPSAR